MNRQEFNRKILENKISQFKAEVKKSAKKLSITEPRVKVWEYPDTIQDQIAHCHHGKN